MCSSVWSTGTPCLEMTDGSDSTSWSAARNSLNSVFGKAASSLRVGCLISNFSMSNSQSQPGFLTRSKVCLISPEHSICKSFKKTTWESTLVATAFCGWSLLVAIPYGIFLMEKCSAKDILIAVPHSMGQVLALNFYKSFLSS